MQDRRRGSRAVGVVAVLLVAAVAGLSVASSLSGGEDGGGTSEEPSTTAPTAARPATTGPPIGDPAALPRPQPGAFAGRLLYVDADCGIAEVDLSTLRTTLRAGGLPGCTPVLSPAGTAGVLPIGPGIGVERFLLGPGGAERLAPGPPLGPAGYGPPAVSDAGAAAVCSTASGSNRPRVTLITADDDVRRVDGCRPAFAGERLLVTVREGAAAVRDGAGRPVVPRAALPRPTRGDLVIATDAGGELVGVLGRTRSLDRVDLALFSLDGEPRRAWQDVHSGADLRTLRVASGGRAAAIDVNGVWRLLALDGDVDAVEAIAGERIADADFAPDGSAAAVVVPDRILLVDARTLGPRAAIPADARSVRWVP